MPSDAFEDLVDTFEFLNDWEDRYAHVIEMGKALPPISEAERSAMTKVDGCASQVWLVPEVSGSGADAVVTFRGDSDALIVKGLIAILITLQSGRPAADIAKTDAQAEFARLGLDKHLSAQRSNGLRAMIDRVDQIAKAALAN
ncbi:cysteine desulfuration protein SufE [Rubricella aquisinus]|uniref:Cysteine desulfuration protein SufE n=1 Tax=Rubricella aquisinus TaxID=2028108 RepID=A0A840WNI7_9RHOB|nr:SufE family protein [Rubricella aquisinus]MBB5516619.1 cysteine desulfuration protein SufE [Rubricella aquisinus]